MWQHVQSRNPMLKDAERMFGFTKFAITLNEMTAVDAGR
jgi:hypothetical protein